MKRCLQLAKQGLGITRPNPSVGAVIVANNKIIGEGYTSPYGGNHAEVNAVNSVRHTELLSKAALYVTLEPCSHYGNTPPCCDLIIQKQISNIVIGCIDTNPLVAGKGIEALQQAGRTVTVGVLEADCQAHHKRFFTYQNKKRPYIILKWAETKDRFIAPESKETQKPVWISNTYSQQLVHKWRSQEHAILVGTRTVMVDNPRLTVRSWGGNHPIRVVLDRNLTIPSDANVFDKAVKTLVLIDNDQKKKVKNHDTIVYEPIYFTQPLGQQICAVLHKHHIQSVIIEGGRQTLQTFLDENLWDEARVFTGNAVFGKGTKAPHFVKPVSVETNIVDNVLRTYKNDTA